MKINNAAYGSSSFFSNNQLKTIELDEIYQKDLIIYEKSSALIVSIEDTIKKKSNEELLLTLIKEIEVKLTERTTFLKQYK